MISNSWRPVRCGVTTVLEEAARHLCARGHEVVFIAPEYPQPVPEEWPALRLPSITLQSDYRGMSPWLPLKPSFWRAIRALHCDLFHAHDSVPFGAGYLGTRIRRRLGTPLVVTQHCFYEDVAMDHFHSRRGGWMLGMALYPLMHFGMGSVLRQADLVLAPSEAAKKDVRRFRSAEIEVLPSGVAVPDTLPELPVRKQLGLPENARVLLSMGRLHPDKNLFLLMDAFARVARAVPESILVLVGEGPLRARLEHRARELRLADRIRFVGAVPHDQVWNWYVAADLLVSTSIRETQGLVFLEAMHCGKPIIAMTAGGASTVVRDGKDGFLVQVTAEAVSDAILHCLGDQETYRLMGQQARERAREFDSRLLIATLEGYYQQVLDRTRAQRPALRD